MNYYEIMNKIISFKNSILKITPEEGIEAICGAPYKAQMDNKIKWFLKHHYIGQKIKISFCSCGYLYIGNTHCNCGKYNISTNIEAEDYNMDYLPTKLHLDFPHWKNNPPTYWNKKIYGR